MKNTIVILLTIFVMHPDANAQKKWTLLQCIDSAITNNLSLNQSFNTTEINRISYNQSRANMLPELSASVNQNLNRSKKQGSQDAAFFTQSNRGTNFAVSGSVVLFNGFQTQNNIRQNLATWSASKYEQEDQQNQLIINVLNAYLQILYAAESVKNAENQVNASNEQMSITQVFVSTGKQSESNLLMIKSQLATDKLTLVNAKSTLKTAKLSLQQLMEIPVYDNFDVEYYPNLNPELIVEENIAGIYQKSLSVLPIVKAYQQRTLAEEYALKSVKNSWIPRLSLGSNFSTNYSSASTLMNTEYGFSTQLQNNVGSSLSLTLSVPIFSRMQVTNNIKIQEIRYKNSMLNQKIENNSLRKDIETANNDLSTASAQYVAVNEQLISVKASYENSKSKYDAGIMNATDLLVEKNKLIKAESDLLEAKYELIFKSKILDYYKGNKIAL